MRVLALSIDGIPRKWISVENAMVYQAKRQVAWSLGDDLVTYHGGIRRIDNLRSELSTPSIIAIKGSELAPGRLRRVLLENKTLFVRDRHLCAYCGKRHLKDDQLSRDHVRPVSKGGLDIWTNVVTACKKCNMLKDDRTPEQAGMKLLYIPYEPNHYENLILMNRNILKDQMDFLMEGVPKHSRLHG